MNIYNVAFIGRAANKALLDKVREILGDGYAESGDYLSVSEIVEKRKEIDRNSSKSVSVADIRNCLEWAEIFPTGSVKVCNLGNLAELNQECSNALLKSLEESAFTVYVGYSESEEALLDTVRSRMVIMRVPNVSEEEYSKKYMQLGLPERNMDASYVLTGGDIELAEDMKTDAAVITSVGVYLNEGKKEQILELLHLLKESDKENFYDDRREVVPYLFEYLRNIAYKRQLERIKSNMRASSMMVAFLTKEIARCKSRTYTKNDFFLAIAKLLR